MEKNTLSLTDRINDIRLDLGTRYKYDKVTIDAEIGGTGDVTGVASSIGETLSTGKERAETAISGFFINGGFLKNNNFPPRYTQYLVPEAKRNSVRNAVTDDAHYAYGKIMGFGRLLSFNSDADINSVTVNANTVKFNFENELPTNRDGGDKYARTSVVLMKLDDSRDVNDLGNTDAKITGGLTFTEQHVRTIGSGCTASTIHTQFDKSVFPTVLTTTRRQLLSFDDPITVSKGNYMMFIVKQSVVRGDVSHNNTQRRNTRSILDDEREGGLVSDLAILNQSATLSQLNTYYGSEGRDGNYDSLVFQIDSGYTRITDNEVHLFDGAVADRHELPVFGDGFTDDDISAVASVASDEFQLFPSVTSVTSRNVERKYYISAPNIRRKSVAEAIAKKKLDFFLNKKQRSVTFTTILDERVPSLGSVILPRTHTEDFDVVAGVKDDGTAETADTIFRTKSTQSDLSYRTRSGNGSVQSLFERMDGSLGIETSDDTTHTKYTNFGKIIHVPEDGLTIQSFTVPVRKSGAQIVVENEDNGSSFTRTCAVFMKVLDDFTGDFLSAGFVPAFTGDQIVSKINNSEVDFEDDRSRRISMMFDPVELSGGRWYMSFLKQSASTLTPDQQGQSAQLQAASQYINQKVPRWCYA